MTRAEVRKQLMLFLRDPTVQRSDFPQSITTVPFGLSRQSDAIYLHLPDQPPIRLVGIHTTRQVKSRRALSRVYTNKYKVATPKHVRPKIRLGDILEMIPRPKTQREIKSMLPPKPKPKLRKQRLPHEIHIVVQSASELTDTALRSILSSITTSTTKLTSQFGVARVRKYYADSDH